MLRLIAFIPLVFWTFASAQSVVKTIEQSMVLVEGGSFEMGCDQEYPNCLSDQKPMHSVALSAFYLSKYEITQEQYQAVVGENYSNFKNCNKCPVEQVSWTEAQEFIAKLNRLTKGKYRLPTEAEWEFAALGGLKSKHYKHSGSDDPDEVAWQVNNSSYRTRPIGLKQPNELGLFDMSGNVSEWCGDWFGETYYSEAPETNPKGPERGSHKVIRGSSWSDHEIYPTGKLKLRARMVPGARTYKVGFRLARDP